MYHRVIDLPFDPQLLAVSPRHFAEHLEVIRSGFHPLSLAELSERLQAGRIPRRAVVVTLDDGYFDNLEHARPALEGSGVPATVFIATDYVDGRREFWWDELERLTFGSGSPDDPGWNVERSHDPTPQHSRYRVLYERLHPLSDEEKWRQLDELGARTGLDRAVRPSHRPLSEAELIRLADGGLVEVGAHSRTHPALAGLAPEAQSAEIEGSRDRLARVLGGPVASFAFPHGSYTSTSLAIVRGAGFIRACTSDTELVDRTADPLRLPRVVPRDWDGDAFGAWLRQWVG
jgi:peptidoglycan/xylan/chitin deacetylase (PgdA/CDA1 family)